MRKLLHFMKPYKALLIAAFLFLIINSFSALYIPTLTAKIINLGVATKNMNYIYKMCGVMLLVALLGGAGYFLSTIYSSRLTAYFARDLREAIFIKTQQYALSDYQKIGISSMITRCTNDITVIQRSFMMFFEMLLPAPVMAIVGLVLAFRTNPTMGFLMVGILIVFSFFAYFIGRKAIPLFREIQIKMDKLTHVLREVITGVRVIRAFNREGFEKNRFNQSCENYCDVAVRTNKVFAILLPVLTLLLNLGIISILNFGGVQVANGGMEIGSIFALIEYLTIILFTGIMAIFVLMEIPRAQSCAERLNVMLDLNPSITDEAIPQLPSDRCFGKVEFLHVTFRYPHAEKPVLNDISIATNIGETTAIIGGTGSGKTTIASLIPRFFDVQEGKILIDGINIGSYSQQELRRKIGFVPQKAFLFRGTIESNIRYGKEDATSAEVENAARIAQAHGFISEMKDGYQSFVAQGGSNLSGGQKQRIAITRALVRKPEIYVFDDSFSALDFKTDAMLRRALREEVKNAAIIIVAQRVSTIMDADQIIVLDEGNVAGIGTHDELMKSCLVYQQIAASQLSESELVHKEVI